MKRAMREHRLDAGLRGWIVNYARKNYWRVPNYYSLDDLIQEGYVCYAKCNLRYRHVREQRHFMALVKRTFANHIHDLAAERTAKPPEILAEPDSPSLIQVEYSDALIYTLLNQLPAELKRLIHVLLTDSRNIPMLRFEDGTRETRNEYLCRLLNVDPALVNIEDVFREHFAYTAYVSNVNRERK